MSLSGHICDIIKVIGTTGILAGHLWAIALAVVTYMGLVQQLGTTLIRVEQAWFGIGLGIYAIAIAVSLTMWAAGGATRQDVRSSQHTAPSEIEGGKISGYIKEFGPSPRQSASLDETSITMSLDQTAVCDQRLGQGSVSNEPLHENMADFINRKARMLILLFPLSYTILVIVSLAKLSYNAVHPQQNLIMNVAGRWTLFLQGGLDALTYGWAGARLKRA
ncbi:hypothetical protein FRC09_017291, partial [Ceratobasidium sp. 395]